jgi:hypothetical protein
MPPLTPPDQFRSLVSVTNIQYATVKRLDERIFHKNAKPFLLEFLIVSFWVTADCEPAIPDSLGITPLRIRMPAVFGAPSAALAAFSRAAASFVTVSIS